MSKRADGGDEKAEERAYSPPLVSAALPYWDAFQRLSGQRDLGGMGAIGAIRLEAVSHWLDEQGLSDPVERERFRFYIEHLDGEYLTMRAKQMEREQSKLSGMANVRHR